MINLQWGPVRIGDGPEILTALRPIEGAELARLARGRTVLEIGSAHGYSAIVMALAGAKHITAVDSHCGWTWLGDTLAGMRRNMASYGVTDEQIDIIQAQDTDALPQLFQEGKSFDLVFIDAGGTYSEVMFDITWAIRLVKHGGVIAVHDYDHVDWPDKKKVCDEFFPEGPDKLVCSLFVKEIK